MSTPDKVQAELQRATELLETNQPKSAEQIARQILKEFPDSKKARRTLGFAFVQQNRPVEAIAVFERLVEETNKDPVCVLDLANVLSQADELERAAQILEDVLEKVATLTPGWFLLNSAISSS